MPHANSSFIISAGDSQMFKYAYHDEDGEHLHTLDGKPLIGTSTACRVIAKPLTWWAAGQALTELGWVNAKKTTKQEQLDAAAEGLAKINALQSTEEWAKMLQRCYQAHNRTKNKAATKGTDMHAELERYVKTCIEQNEGRPLISWTHTVFAAEQVRLFAAWAVEHVEYFLWTEAHCYCENLWVGGISDCGALMKTNNIAVLDFKSSRDAYFDQFVQCAGYSIQIERNGLFDANGTRLNEFQGPIEELYVVPFGATDPTPRQHLNVGDRQRDFVAAVTLYKSSQLETWSN